MARGGARPGAGRKKGGHNRLTELAIEQARETGEMPLDFMLAIMRDTQEVRAVRLDAAKAAAQYLHPKLSAIEADVRGRFTVGDVLDALD